MTQACASSGGKAARETCVVFPLGVGLGCTLRDGSQKIREWKEVQKYVCMPNEDFFAEMEDCKR